MPERIYLIGDHGDLEPMEEQDYDEEAILQKLLESYPDLLAGEQINSGSPRRWLLIKREMEVADSEDTEGRWSLDHLFVDQDGVLTLVEVKRSTDTRIRREVVGQMLDYAANAVVYWPMEQIRSAFEQTCTKAKRDPQQVLLKFLDTGDIDDGTGIPNFWKRVEENLQAERIRLIFVADTIPAELRRIIEFLNGQMRPADVLAIEIKQFVGQGRKAMVPKVVGLTAKAATKKSDTKAEPRAKFIEVVGVYNARTTDGLKTIGKAAGYRQIAPQNWPGRIHYEFMNHRDGVGVELHLESKDFVQIVDFLQQLIPAVRKVIPSGDFQWDPTWSGGKGRILGMFPDAVPSETIAAAMTAFITTTIEPITKRLKELGFIKV